ncbi:hypothetical protein GCM10023176_54230 [Micromonospora coerulea]|uniref:Uncharacterized protein n=1 Tax=Micromonospora coerulea TaxID=47856 RepID=A0ABP8T315_9ACTN
MLVAVEKIARFPGCPVLAQVRTSIGHTAVRWCGEPDAPAGQYHVEWEIDEEISGLGTPSRLPKPLPDYSRAVTASSFAVGWSSPPTVWGSSTSTAH